MNKNRNHTDEHRRLIKDAKFKHYGQGNCLNCGNKYNKYTPNQKVCTPKCGRQLRVKEYHQLKITDPIGYKARSMSGTVRLGKNKVKQMIQLISNALEKPCEYCETILTLGNISLDHKQPRTNNRLYQRKDGKKVKLYSKLELQQLDSLTNLHIVCKLCNQLKGDMTHEQFIRLLVFLNEDLVLKQIMVKRLTTSFLFFKRK